MKTESKCGQNYFFLIFYMGCPLLNVKFSLNGSEIEIVKEFNYLLNRTCNFNKAITKHAEKGKKARYKVMKRGLTHSLSSI